MIENLPVQTHAVAEPPPAEGITYPLAHGLDWLDISLTLDWGRKPPNLFEDLTATKQLAQAKANQTGQDDGTPFRFSGPDSLHWWAKIHGWGGKGYEWRLESKDMSWQLMNKTKPCSRPSLLVHFSPLALWTHGPANLVRLVESLLAHHGATIQTATVSRMDLTMDLMTKKEVILNGSTPDHAVTRSAADQIHRQHRKVNAFGIGAKGSPLTCRIYDKALELKKHPEKSYICAVWGFEKPPAGCQVARIEFQLRRQAIRQFLPKKKVYAGLDEITHLLDSLRMLWMYLTAHWLRFVDNPRAKCERQDDLPWWWAVRTSWRSAQDGDPMVRDCTTGANATTEMLSKQITGCLLAIDAIENPVAPDAALPENLQKQLEFRAQQALQRTTQNKSKMSKKLTLCRARQHSGPPNAFWPPSSGPQ